MSKETEARRVFHKLTRPRSGGDSNHEASKDLVKTAHQATHSNYLSEEVVSNFLSDIQTPKILFFYFPFVYVSVLMISLSVCLSVSVCLSQAREERLGLQ